MLLAIVLVILLYFQLYVDRSARLSALWLPSSIGPWLTEQLLFLIPVVGTLLGYKSIVGERESGSLKLLLTLPHSRRDVILGKFLGRAMVMVCSVFLAFFVVGVQFAASSELFSITVYATAAVKTALVGVTFVAIAIAFSTTLRSSLLAMWGAFGLMVLFVFLWDSVLTLVKSFLEPASNDSVGISELPEWFYLLKRFNPRHAFADVTPPLYDGSAFYLEPWFSVVILVVWLVVPLGIAYLHFERSDLA